MTENTPGRRWDGTDTDTNIGTVTDNSTRIDDRLTVNLSDAPTVFTRIVQVAAATGGFATLVEDGVWSFEMDDWAIFMNGADEATIETYDPWGDFNVQPLTAVIFRTGLLAGVADEESSEFQTALRCSEEDIVVEALEEYLDALDFDFAAAKRGDA